MGHDRMHAHLFVYVLRLTDYAGQGRDPISGKFTCLDQREKADGSMLFLANKIDTAGTRNGRYVLTSPRQSSAEVAASMADL